MGYRQLQDEVTRLRSENEFLHKHLDGITGAKESLAAFFTALADVPTGFDMGVLWSAARLVELFDEPTMACELLRQSGVSIEKGDEADMPFLKRITFPQTSSEETK